MSIYDYGFNKNLNRGVDVLDITPGKDFNSEFGTYSDVGTTIRSGVSTSWSLISKGRLSASAATLFDVSRLSKSFDVYKLQLRINSAATTGPTVVGLRFDNDATANYYSRVNENGVVTLYSATSSLRLSVTGVSDTADGLFDITIGRPDGDSVIVTWHYHIFDQGIVLIAHGGGTFDIGNTTTTYIINSIQAIVLSGANFGVDSGWILEAVDVG